MAAYAVSEDDLQLVYTWVDSFTLSRPKKNIARDFSDARICLFTVVLAAEIIKSYFPSMVELHNYPETF